MVKTMPTVTYTQPVADVEFLIGPTDGRETIAGTKNIFRTGLRNRLNCWERGLKRVAPAGWTPAIHARVHETTRDGTFRQFFESISKNLETLCFNESQILAFVRKYEAWLSPRTSLFLFRSGDAFLVATTGCDVDNLFADLLGWVTSFDSGLHCGRHYLIVPGQTEICRTD